jgi:hypothetical protein
MQVQPGMPATPASASPQLRARPVQELLERGLPAQELLAQELLAQELLAQELPVRQLAAPPAGSPAEQ